MLRKTVSWIMIVLLLIHTVSLISPLVNAYPYFSTEDPKDVLIINDPHKHAYFGWFQASNMNSTAWQLLNRTILWASGYIPPNDTRIVFFTEPPSNGGDGTLVYFWLMENGYREENVELFHPSGAEDLPSEYYNTTDLVIYWERFPYSSMNIVNAGVPFITVCALQTEEMGIGTGCTTMYSLNSTFQVINNNYYPTSISALGPLQFESEIEFEATQALEDGKVLVSAEVESVCDYVEMATIQNIEVLSEGKANMSFTVFVQDGPLADMVRESFFANPSALEPLVEYDMPEFKKLESKAEAEKEIKDVTLPGDVSDGDGKCDIKDIAFVAKIFGAILGGEDYNAELDINWDGKVDIKDVATAAKNFGKIKEYTGSLYVVGYYNGSAVDCTNVHLKGPEGTPLTNISAVGHVWYNLKPGSYKVFGTYNTIETSTDVTVERENFTYAQLDFGEAPPPPPETDLEPVKLLYNQGIIMEQLILLGFDINFTDSRIMPWGEVNETTIWLEAQCPYFTKAISWPVWQINVGPGDENATSNAAEHTFTKIQYMKQALRSLYGDQYYDYNWQMWIQLPETSEVLNSDELEGLNWTIDFGGGTYMETNITLGWFMHPYIRVDEKLHVTEQDIAASEEYLAEAFTTYKRFNVTYEYFGTPPPELAPTCEVEDDWERTWWKTISPGTYIKTWRSTVCNVTAKITPWFHAGCYVGWYKKYKFPWYYKLQWFQAHITLYAGVKTEVSATAKGRFRKTWSNAIWYWQTKFNFWVGPVYVWAKLRLKVEAKVNVDAYGRVSVSTWTNEAYHISAGVRWEKDVGWKRIWLHYRSSASHPKNHLKISGAATIWVKAYAWCITSFLFYGVAGPYFQARADALIWVGAYWRQWSIEARLKIIAGVTMTGWLRDLIGLDGWSVWCCDFQLAYWSGNW